MISAELIAHFHLLGDAPETVQQLRKVIVALAIRGKLSNEGKLAIDASSLRDEIQKRRHALTVTGELRRKEQPEVVAEDLPADFLDTSRFVRLGFVANVEKGVTGIQSAKQGPYPLVVTAADRATCDHFDFEGAAAIVPLVSSAGHGKASLNRLHYQEGKFALGSILAAVFPLSPDLISARFLFEYLTAFKEELLVSRMSGTANVTLTVGRLCDVPVPLIAPATQKRIDELMALCDQLEAARNEREARRDQLVAASLDRIGTAPTALEEGETGAPSATRLRDAVRFHLDHLPRLTTRPEHIKQLRQTILNLAVRGRLVPQDPNDEPVYLQAEACEVLPAGIPATWIYTCLENLLAEDTRNGYSRRPDDAPDGVPILRISAGTIRPDGVVAEEEHKLISGVEPGVRLQYGLNPGDLLACRFNGNKAFVGRLTIFIDYLGIKPIYPDKLIRIRASSQLAMPEYLRLAGDTDLVRTEIEAACATTVGNWGISASNLKEIRFPLPPLAEQHRIVAKVDELMALCDQLEAQLVAAQTNSRRLLEAVLHEALAA